MARLSQRYVTALKGHLKPGSRVSLRRAVGLGHQAVILGLETLELARIHDRALVTLGLPNGKNGLIKRAEFFLPKRLLPSWRRIAPRGNARLS